MQPAEDPAEYRSVLLVNSDPHLSKVLTISLKTLGLTVRDAVSPSELGPSANQPAPAVIIADLDGKMTAQQLMSAKQELPNSHLLVLLSERLSDEVRSELHPDQVVYKPFDTRYLCRKVEELLSNS